MCIKRMFPLLLLILAATAASAQWNVVIETERMMSFGSRPGFRLEFTNTETGTVETLWKDFVKENFKGKLKKDRKTDEWVATGLKSAMMGDDAFGIYSTIEKTDKGSALNVWIDAGSYFLNRRDNPGHTEEVTRSLRQFYLDVRRSAIGQEMKEEENKLKELEAKQKKLAKDNDNLHKDIDSYKAKIKKAEEDLVKNNKDQETTILDTEAQRRQIEAVKRRLDNVENEKN